MTDRPPRKAIPDAVKFADLDRQDSKCACGCGESVGMNNATFPTRFDHRPPLALRDISDDGTDYIPQQLNPYYIDALTPDCHDRRTFGGAAKATTLNSDAHTIAKGNRLDKFGVRKKNLDEPREPKPRFGRRQFKRTRP